jgi:hypothetical protein
MALDGADSIALRCIRFQSDGGELHLDVGGLRSLDWGPIAIGRHVILVSHPR